MFCVANMMQWPHTCYKQPTNQNNYTTFQLKPYEKLLNLSTFCPIVIINLYFGFFGTQIQNWAQRGIKRCNWTDIQDFTGVFQMHSVGLQFPLNTSYINLVMQLLLHKNMMFVAVVSQFCFFLCWFFSLSACVQANCYFCYGKHFELLCCYTNIIHLLIDWKLTCIFSKFLFSYTPISFFPFKHFPPLFSFSFFLSFFPKNIFVLHLKVQA